MADTLCRVTVVGDRRRVDLALPAGDPIAEYVPQLVRMCGQPLDDTLPAAWSLALVGHPVLRPEQSLGEAGVVDGQVLHLRDIADGVEDAAVHDIAEIIDRESAPRCDSRAHAAGLLVTAGVWLAALPVLLAVTGTGRAPGGSAVAAFCPILLVTAAWLVRQRRWPVPPAVTGILAALAVPAATAAGWCLDSGGRPAVLAASVGAVLGALVALCAAPGLPTIGLAGVVVPLGVATGTAAAAGSSLVPLAIAVAFLAGWLLPAVPAAAAAVATLIPAPTGSTASAEELAAVPIRRAFLLAITWEVAVHAVLVGTFVVLATRHRPVELLLVAALGTAAALTARTATHLAAAVPAYLTAGAAAFAILTAAPAALAPADAHAVLPALGAGVALAAVALALAVRSPREAPVAASQFVARATTACLVLAVPAAVVALGVLDPLVRLGHHL